MQRPERRFAFRLSLALGVFHPDYLLTAISSRQLAEWIAFQRLEPFGETRADFRSGIIASTIANVFRGKKQPAAAPTDFMPRFSRPPAENVSIKVRKTMKSLLKKIHAE